MLFLTRDLRDNTVEVEEIEYNLPQITPNENPHYDDLPAIFYSGVYNRNVNPTLALDLELPNVDRPILKVTDLFIVRVKTAVEISIGAPLGVNLIKPNMETDSFSYDEDGYMYFHLQGKLKFIVPAYSFPYGNRFSECVTLQKEWDFTTKSFKIPDSANIKAQIDSGPKFLRRIVQVKKNRERIFQTLLEEFNRTVSELKNLGFKVEEVVNVQSH